MVDCYQRTTLGDFLFTGLNLNDVITIFRKGEWLGDQYRRHGDLQRHGRPQAPCPLLRAEGEDFDCLGVDQHAADALGGVETHIRFVGVRGAQYPSANAVDDGVRTLKVAKGDGVGIGCHIGHAGSK